MSTPTIAQTSPLALTPFLGAGLTFGGETLATTYYDNGDSQDVTTGGLVDLRAGIEYRLTNSPVALQMAVAYHVGNTTAKNGSLKFSRFPVELVGMYDFGNQWRVGFGIRQATGAKVSASGDAVYQAGYGASTSFKADTGALIQLEYRVSPQVGIQARYVKDLVPNSGLQAPVNIQARVTQKCSGQREMSASDEWHRASGCRQG
ncbi:MAG: outer membrane beta-barrel protein [Aquabacterium sp.]|nr:outer membrane beta-barrel protein [Aquabacterium sp.]